MLSYDLPQCQRLLVARVFPRSFFSRFELDMLGEGFVLSDIRNKCKDKG
jgi:hypothetical protein